MISFAVAVLMGKITYHFLESIFHKYYLRNLLPAILSRLCSRNYVIASAYFILSLRMKHGETEVLLSQTQHIQLFYVILLGEFIIYFSFMYSCLFVSSFLFRVYLIYLLLYTARVPWLLYGFFLFLLSLQT